MSRNPIYVSDWFVYLGVTLLLGTAWPLLLAPLVWLIDAFWRHRPRGSPSAGKFGDEYRDYL
jgi:protein-S-isoprenylcysteine O-methyltransferase Ste14